MQEGALLTSVESNKMFFFVISNYKKKDECSDLSVLFYDCLIVDSN